MAAIAGLRGTGNFGTDERPKSFREMILWRNPNGVTPLTGLLSKMESQSVNDPEFNWWEEELNAIRLQIAYATGFSTTDTSLTVGVAGDQTATDLVAGDVLLVEKALTTAYDHELLVVSSITSSSVVVVKRAQAGTTAVPILQGVYLTKISNAFAEGGLAPDSATRNPTKMYNYCQIWKTAYQVTKTAAKTKFRTGDPLKNDKKRKRFDHAVALELSFIFGKRYEDTGGQQPTRYTGGILNLLSLYSNSRITAFTTTPTETTMLDAIYPIWDYDTSAGNERIGFCGNGALNSLNKMAKNASSTRINFDKKVDAYGMKLMEWTLPQGTVYFRSHPLFNTHGRFTNDIFIFDPSVLKYRYMRDTEMEDGIEPPGADYFKGQYLTEAGLEFQHSKTTCWLSNFVVP